MTKQNTHSEHSDVDISVAGHSLASEDQAFLPSLETDGTASPVLPPADMGSSPEEQPDRHTPQEEQNPASGEENQNIQEEAPVKPDGESFAETLFQDQPEIVIAGSGEESSAVEAALESPIVDALVVEEEVRPFTDFIEEFRQAETRFNSSLQAYEAESLSLLATTAEEVASIDEYARRYYEYKETYLAMKAT